MTDIFGVTTRAGLDPFGRGIGNLRAGLNAFVAKHPNWHVYVRRDERFPHPDCYNPITKSPDTGCQICFGLGFKVQFEKHRTRRVLPADAVQSPIEEFGYLSKFKAIMYTPRYYYPKSKDLYLEVEWNVDIENIEAFGKPIHIVNAYQVDETVAYREDEVTYIGAGCDTYNFTIKDQENWLLALGEVWAAKREI